MTDETKTPGQSRVAQRAEAARHAAQKLADEAKQRGGIQGGAGEPDAAPAAAAAPSTIMMLAAERIESGALVKVDDTGQVSPATVRREQPTPAGFMLVVNGQLSRKNEARPLQFAPTQDNWQRFQAAFNGSSHQVGLNYLLQLGLDAAAKLAASQGGVLKVNASDLN